jgi:FixJ family two-component response regulator
VVDDDGGIRHALTALFASVGIPARAYPSGDAFLAHVREDTAGCLVLDVRMPGMGGLELQQELARRGLRLPILVISGHADVPMAVRALKAGADDFLEKPLNEQELLEKVQACMARHADMQAQLVEHEDAQRRIETLTPREREVLGHMMEGKPSKVIAGLLDISPKTVDVHRARVFDKMGVSSLAQLVKLVLTVEQTEPASPP